MAQFVKNPKLTRIGSGCKYTVRMVEEKPVDSPHWWDDRTRRMEDYSIGALRAAVRDVPDFPQPGIVFKDITPLLADPLLLKGCMAALVATARGERIDTIVGIDARGFIFAAVVADRLGAGFVPVRKAGKLPWRTLGIRYELEYGSATIEMHVDAVRPGDRIMLVDDVLATGGTAAAALELVRQAGGEIVAASFLIELGALNGRAKLPADVRVESILAY